MLLARRVSILRGCERCIRFEHENRSIFISRKERKKTIPFTVNIKKKKKEEDGGCSWRRLFFTRYKNLLANVTLLPRYYGRKNIAYFFFFNLYHCILLSIEKKEKEKKDIISTFSWSLWKPCVTLKKNARNKKMFSPYMTNEKHFFFFYGSHVPGRYTIRFRDTKLHW